MNEIKWEDHDNIVLKPKGVPWTGCHNPQCPYYNIISSMVCDKCKKDRDWMLKETFKKKE